MFNFVVDIPIFELEFSQVPVLSLPNGSKPLLLVAVLYFSKLIFLLFDLTLEIGQILSAGYFAHFSNNLICILTNLG